MFAKLFDHISLRSLVNALSFSLVVLLSAIFLPLGSVKLGALEHSLVLPQQLSLLLVVLFCGFFAFIFNEYQNRQRDFKGQNHLLVVLVLVLYTTQIATNNLHVLVLLPLSLLFFSKLSRLVTVPDAKHLCFDLGLLTGLYSLLYGQLILLFVVTLVSALFQSKLNIRALMALILGVFGSVSFVAAVGVFFNLNVFEIWFNELASIGFSFQLYSGLTWVTAGFVFIFIALSYFSLSILLNKANAMQRGKYTLWYLAQTSILSFTFILNEKATFGLFLALPLSWLISKVLLETKNKWFRDSIYFLLLSSAAYQALHLMGILTF